jgi:hypothetical protein
LNVDAFVDETLDVRPPLCRSRPNIEQARVDRRGNRSQGRKELVPNPIAEESHRAVRRIFDPFDATCPSVCDDVASPDVQQRPEHRSIRRKTGKTASSRVTQRSHQHRLDLIIRGVSGCNPSPEIRDEVIEKSPTNRAKLCLGVRGYRRGAAVAFDAEIAAPARDEIRRFRRVGAGAVVERRDRDPRAS